MIEYLSGRLIDKSPTHVVVLCGGVGYGAQISLATYERLPDVGMDTALYATLVVREDSLTLYAFATPPEREMFLLLTSVTGIGPRIAMNVLSAVGIDTLRENIARGNSVALTALPGIGRKTAERIGLELRDKIAASMDLAAVTPSHQQEPRVEALAALQALGYSRPAAEKAIRSATASAGDDASVEALIKLALKHMND